MTPANARAVLRIAAGLPHPSEAHAALLAVVGDRAPAEIAKVRARVAALCRDHGATPAKAWGDVIEAAGKRNMGLLIYVLAALHDAQLDGEVAP